jgi:preprotein translocase subunit SecY
MMWLGEMITERGIGNGVSILICVNIVSDLPGALVQVWQTYVGGAALRRKRGKARSPGRSS